MTNGESEEIIRYFPEKINQPKGTTLGGETKDQNHMANWIDCVRSRKTPNAPVELGYQSAIAVHMANLSYRHQHRVTLEEAKSVSPGF